MSCVCDFLGVTSGGGPSNCIRVALPSPCRHPLVTALVRVQNDGNSHSHKIVFFFFSLCRVNSQVDKKEQEEDGEQGKKLRGRGKKDIDDLDSDDDDDELSDLGDDNDDDDDSVPKKTKNKSDVLPVASRVSIKD